MGAIVLAKTGRIPRWVVNHASFRKWARSREFPREGRFGFLKEDIWVDLSMETLIHNQIKTRLATRLDALVESLRLGFYLGDRMMLTHPDVGLSTEPDGMFVSRRSLRTGKVILREGDDTLEVEGSPDMVLEVVSKYSEENDLTRLPLLYWQAGIREYWRVDPRQTPASFTIQRRGAKGYVSVKPMNGWLKSKVCGKSFRLVQTETIDNVSQFKLEVK